MIINNQDLPKLLLTITQFALEAGVKAMEIYGTDFTTETKSDASPVTQADKLGEEIILRGLKAAYPDIPVLAEESVSDGEIPQLSDEFFLVDPIDGTREFINKTGEFTVNIALIRDRRPVAGVVYAPAIGKLYAGAASHGASLSHVNENGEIEKAHPIAARAYPETDITAIASRSHRSPETEEYLKTLDIKEFVAAGSSLKFCIIAEGKADIYPRFGRTMEWDTGAGQAVLEAAGGSVDVYPDGGPLNYRKEDRGYDNPYFIAFGEKKA